MSSEFDRIKRGLLKRGELFEDPEFPCTQSSVFYHQTPPFNFIWKRPGEICSDPQFLNNSVQPNCLDISPGKLGDRWFLSCLGVVSLTKGLFYRAVPADQSFNAGEYAGLFRFRIWWFGEWKEVLVDDRLPTVNNKLVFVNSIHGNTFWAPLLEKAFAKLHDSYEALKYGASLEGLSDLTGGIGEIISLKDDPSLCGPVINKLLEMTSIITAIVENENVTNNHLPFPRNGHNFERLANGILLSTSYRVTAIDKVETVDGESVNLVKLVNPLGPSSDYLGSFSKDSRDWERICDEDRMRVGQDTGYSLAEGEFHMKYTDFVKTFTRLEVIHLDGETSRDEPTLRGRIPWTLKLWRGIWRKGVTGGGCRNHVDTFHINPQLEFSLNEEEDDLVIGLSQHSVLEPKVIGFSVYCAPSKSDLSNSIQTTDNRLERSWFKRNKSVVNSAYTNSKQISLRCQLDGVSPYVLMPTTFEPGQEATFSVRIYSTKGVKLRFLDSIPCVIKPAIIKAPSSFDAKFSQYETLFLQLADEHKTVNAFELQELLEACLPNDYVKSCATLEVCRQIVSSLDVTGFGRLKYIDYKNVMCSLRFWQNTFKNHTKGTSGILRVEKYKEALYDIGFQLNSDILGLLVLRYMRKDGTLRFGDFVLSILHLTVAFNCFHKKDPTDSGNVKLNLTDWLKAALQV